MLLTPLIQKFGSKPFLESKQQFTEDFIKNNFSSLLKSGLNMFAVAATCTTEKTPDEDYEGKWEDAFLFSGFDRSYDTVRLIFFQGIFNRLGTFLLVQIGNQNADACSHPFHEFNKSEGIKIFSAVV